ncbi:MAG: FMN-binding protein [Bacteroidales bacterium]|jgi:Na+-transporting NADH:ubiquinone oxidoreductase subunit C|nr:FMN-binding protein [Bacteroidales bacterium]MDD2263955.1 FMN-binding protein [Bacteroidales bacterium]MDD2831189.1 FMN-binding protein [Bacteroidales bacterium]MDD3209300.1 FMN-binding protein [Bacteroidales bacterium]MDD3697573.1 FMN-binding protein [Bacteroidales bacterium]
MDNRKRNGNVYTFIYAAIMVIVVAALLSFVSQVLKPRQVANMMAEKQQSILRSVHLEGNLYERYIRDTVVGPAHLALYICTLEDGTRKYIIPLAGKGLWGPLRGYLALNGDFRTIYGAVFDHDAETPGLGAEITTAAFSDSFRGKSLYQADRFVSLSILKPGKAASNPNAVDGISGGTLTSRGVENMIRESLEPYLPFFKHYE